MKPIPSLELIFRRAGKELISVEDQFHELYEFERTVHDYSPLLQEWFLTSDKSKEDALLYPAFDEHGPTTAALAVLKNRSKGVTDIRSISIWNGADTTAKNAGMSSSNSVLGNADTFEFSLRLEPAITDWKTPLAWMQRSIEIWKPKVATFGPFWYSDHKVFKDRPGASWLLYLPKVLTVQHVPEARALVPVLDQDRKQIGTIIVSVTDGPFDDRIPEHVKAANAIEIRLVDQDLLPRYVEL